MTVILITGCSSGIGLETAVLLAQKGNIVYATMRDTSKKDKIELLAKENNTSVKVLQLDVTDENSVQNAIGDILEKEGSIDVLINNAGYGLIGAIECLSIDSIKKQFEVNLFGLIRVTQAVLPIMRNQKRGHIINISSIAGIRATSSMEAYNSSKFAVEGLTEGMAPALSKFNIKLTLIEPGPVHTEFLGTSMQQPEKFIDEIYKEQLDKRLSELENVFEKAAQNANEIAKIIAEVVSGENTDFRVQTSDWVKKAASDKIVELTGNNQLKNAIDQL